MPVMTSAGSTLRVSSVAPATFDAIGYAVVFPTLATAANPVVGEITDLGEFGREYALVTHNPLGTRGTAKFKGSFNAGQISLQLALDNDDAGQMKLREALNVDSDYYFAVTLQNGDKSFFAAKVMSFKTSVGSVDQITNATVMLEITTNNAGIDIVSVNS